MKIILYIYSCFTICFGQFSFHGINTWTQSSAISLAGGGFLIDFENDFKNPGTLKIAKRKIKFSSINYPADITAQSMIANGSFKGHNFGFKVSRLNYGIFEGRNIDNQLTKNYTAGDINFEVGYANSTLSKRINWGVAGGVFLSRLDESKASAIILSPGIVINTKIFTLGMTLKNFGKVIKQYGGIEEKMPSYLIGSISRQLSFIPLKIEIDHSYSINSNHTYSVLSGIYKFDKNLFIKGGTSTNRLDQTINSSFFRNIFSDFGIGLIYKIEDIVVDVNSYSYGTGGLVFAIGLSVYY
tara:strand:+ start:503 stop:1396 length:894 start_codon:yes stop_codon:yes gene_type:complete